MLTKIFYEASALPFQLSMTEMGRAEAEFPNLFKYRTYSAGEFIDEFIKDPRLKAVLGAGYWESRSQHPILNTASFPLFHAAGCFPWRGPSPREAPPDRSTSW